MVQQDTPRAMYLVFMPRQRMGFFLCVGLVASGSFAQAPRLFEPYVFAGYAVGLEACKLEVDSGNAVHQIPWFTIALDAGGAVTYRERLTLALQGSLAYNGLYFFNEDLEYRVYHRLFRTEARVNWQLRYRDYTDRKLRVGFGVGLDIQRTGYHWKEQGEFYGRSDAPKQHRLYFAPEIAMYTDESVEVGIRYIWHPDRSPAMYTTLTTPGSGAHATATHDQVAVLMRYYLGFPRKQRDRPFYPAVDYAARETDTLTTLHATYRTIVLELWDNAEYDGDTISILLGDKPIVTDLELTPRHRRITVALQPGLNNLLIIANNEGRVPPNTALCRVHRVKGKPLLSVHTSERSNQLVQVMLDP